ncbi:MAG: MotA/TolQ/ExbB proton channel family protein [Pseudomonadales bacterium]|nr:MotA/TolQ/ExbB proton channel family protein [Pseudomonadales bacterium]MBP6226317.1 MotA/TolQ/ExbB proton channel family protein [Pseudomonadales bacterium]
MVENIPLLRGVIHLVGDGGPYVAWIFASGVLMWAMVIERYWYFRRILPQQAMEMQAQWNARTDHSSWCARQIRQTMISRLNASMTVGFPVLQVLVPMSPLLGLIGTVTGMLGVFDSMALRGNADARSMASGVSQAMICTMTGLAVSITGLYPVHYFRTRASQETELLADRLPL